MNTNPFIDDLLPRRPTQFARSSKRHMGTNKFRKPHQGLRECTRRGLQIRGRKLESKPRRMWSLLVHWQDHNGRDRVDVICASSTRQTVRNHVAGEFVESYLR